MLYEEEDKKKKKINLAAIMAKQEADKKLKLTFIEQGLNPETFTKLKMTESERELLNKVKVLKLQVTFWNHKETQPPKFGV